MKMGSRSTTVRFVGYRPTRNKTKALTCGDRSARRRINPIDIIHAVLGEGSMSSATSGSLNGKRICTGASLADVNCGRLVSSGLTELKPNAYQ